MIYSYTQFLNEARTAIKNSPNLPDEYPKLYDAIHQGNIEWVRAIVEKGIDVNLIMYHKTPLLHTAIYSRKFPEKMCEIVQILLDAGADIDFRRTDNDSTALLSAIKFVDIRNWKDNTIFIKFLLDSGADPRIGNKDNQTPLLYTMSREYDLIKLLLEKGADPNIKDRWGWTPLFSLNSMGKNNLDKLKLLYEYGVDLNYQNKKEKGKTFLMKVLRQANRHKDTDKYYNIVKWLLEHGADPNLQLYDGRTALFICDDIRIFKLLVEYGGNFEKVTKKNKTPIFSASHRNNMDIVTYLIEKGVDVDYEDNAGKQFIDYLKYINRNIIVNRYPEKMKYYLSGNSFAVKQMSDKYNL